MKNDSITASCTDIGGGEVAILIDASVAGEFFSYLQSNSISANPPRDAVFKILSRHVDERGRIVTDEVAVVREIVAKMPENDFDEHFAKWFQDPSRAQ